MSPIQQREQALGAREEAATTPTDPAAPAPAAAVSSLDHDAPDHGAPDHDAPDHDAPDHDAPDHGAPDHGALDHDAPDHGALDHDAPDHGALDHDAPDHDAPDPPLPEPSAAGRDDAQSSAEPSSAERQRGAEVTLPVVRRSSRALAVVAVAALLLSLGAVAAIGLGIYHYHQVLAKTEKVEDEEEASSTKRAGLPADGPSADEDEAEPTSLDDVIVETLIKRRGSVEVVDVGARSASLPEVLRAQSIVAEAKQQKLLLMLTGRRCEPCRDFDAAIDHPLLQQALVDVRIVRIDLDVFKDELKRMHLPTNLFPAFFVLGDDLRPLDAIHGGEWDDDVPENIAPIIAAFVRGELRGRRHVDWAPTTSSIPL